jgi:hypothetical protein
MLRKHFGLHQQALLLLLSVSSLQRWHGHGVAAAAAAAPAAQQSSAAAGADLLSYGGQVLTDQSLPLWTKPSNVTDASADSVAPASVRLRYRGPSFSPGPSGRWDNYDYQDIRNSNPTSYCPRACKVVSTRIARCQCVTRASLQAFYSGRRWGRYYWPECCYLRPPPDDGGGSSSGGSSGGPNPSLGNSWAFKLYTIGSCSEGGLQVIKTNLRNFLATMPGVCEPWSSGVLEHRVESKHRTTQTRSHSGLVLTG